jgi:hypothetical protein
MPRSPFCPYGRQGTQGHFSFYEDNNNKKQGKKLGCLGPTTVLNVRRYKSREHHWKRFRQESASFRYPGQLKPFLSSCRGLPSIVVKICSMDEIAHKFILRTDGISLPCRKIVISPCYTVGRYERKVV